MTGVRTAAVILVCLPALVGQHPPDSRQRPTSKVWVGRYQEIEDYLRTGECVSVQQFGPARAARCTLRPGGPVARMAWRSMPPGPHRGFRESYKTEIAAYELDKLLKLDMVPPTVGRQLLGADGAAQLWVENMVDGTARDSPEEADRSHWESQLALMAMFDNLIGNKERNRANMLRDAAWNLVLIDHSRAFGTDTDLVHAMNRIDEGCWARIESLTPHQLDVALGAWLGEDQIRAILQRRETMRTGIRSLPK